LLPHDLTIQPAIEVDMSQTISIEKKNELFENFQKTGFADHTDGFETIVELPQAIGKGFVREIDN
jgi:hypothetical protein